MGLSGPPADRLRWGLLGTARVNRRLIPALRASSRHTLTAVASRTAARAAAYAAEHGIPRWHAPYDALLADPAIDVVYNALPNSLHAEWTLRALDHAKHVLCEKPLATRPDAVPAIDRAARRAGRIVAEAFVYRHHPQTAEILRLVRGGAIGELRAITGVFTYLQNRADDVRLVPELDGGSLWDIGCYPVSYALLIGGGLPISATGVALTGPTGVDVGFAGILELEAGVLAHFDCGFRAAYRTGIEIAGTAGRLLVPNPFRPGPHEQILRLRDTEAETIPIAGDDPFRLAADDLAGAVLDGGAGVVSLQESHRTALTLAGLHTAARERRRVILR